MTFFIKRILELPTMVDRNLIEKKLLLLQTKREELQKFPKKNFEDFKKDLLLQKAVEKMLEELIQICIDIGKHIVSDEHLGIPDSNRGLMDILKEKKIISAPTHELMKKMIGFRNILVHGYDKVDVATVYVSYVKKLKDFDHFLKDITKYLETKR